MTDGCTSQQGPHWGNHLTVDWVVLSCGLVSVLTQDMDDDSLHVSDAVAGMFVRIPTKRARGLRDFL